MSKKLYIGFIYNELIQKAEPLVNKLRTIIPDHYSIWISPGDIINVSPDILQETKIIVTAGGDGTILKASRISSEFNIPILGINLGRVGFMTELQPENAEKEIINYLDDSKIEYDSRLMLQCEIFNTTTSKLLQTHNALNDIVISRGSDPKLLDINTEIDSVDLHTYRADGLIISSPTGTTGYSLAAGGPIISPNSDVMLLQPLAAHMNFSKSLVVGKSSIINISLVSKQSASLIVDGIKEIDFSTDHLLRIRKSSNSTVFIRKDSKNNFYATLTNRLLS